MAIAGLVTGAISLVAISVVAVLPGMGFWALAFIVLLSVFVIVMAMGGAALSSAMGAKVGRQILASFNGPPFAEPAVVALWSIGSKSGHGSILVVPFQSGALIHLPVQEKSLLYDLGDSPGLGWVIGDPHHGGPCAVLMQNGRLVRSTGGRLVA